MDIFSVHMVVFVQSILSVNYTCSNSIKIFLLDTKLIYICIFYAM